MAMIPTRHNVTGHTAEFPEDTIPAWRERGWVPFDEIEPETPADEPAATPTTRPARARAASTEES